MIRRWLGSHRGFAERYLEYFPDHMASLPHLKARLINSLTEHPGPDYRQAVNGLIKLLDEIGVNQQEWRDSYRLPKTEHEPADDELDEEDEYLAALDN